MQFNTEGLNSNIRLGQQSGSKQSSIMLSIHQCTGGLHPTLTPFAAGSCNCSPLYTRIHVTSATSLVVDVNHPGVSSVNQHKKNHTLFSAFHARKCPCPCQCPCQRLCFVFVFPARSKRTVSSGGPISCFKDLRASPHILCGFSEGVVLCETLY